VILPLLLQAAPAPDVVVTAERLRKLRLAATMAHGRLTGCTVSVSSGSARIDAAACQAMRACVADGVTASEPLADCIDTRVAALVQGGAADDTGSKP
jgi:hypothetical protein